MFELELKKLFEDIDFMSINDAYFFIFGESEKNLEFKKDIKETLDRLYFLENGVYFKSPPLIKKCLYCKKEFETRNKNQSLCSACKKKVISKSNFYAFNMNK